MLKKVDYEIDDLKVFYAFICSLNFKCNSKKKHQCPECNLPSL